MSFTEFSTIENTTERVIYDHHFDAGGDHRTSTIKQAWVYCPSCKGRYSSLEVMWDQKYRNEVALLSYDSDLEKVNDPVLQSCLLLAQTHKIGAIKQLRMNYPSIGLFNAKRIIERCSVETVVTYEVTRG